MRALREQLVNEPHIFLSGHCSPRTSNSAFFPIIDLLERQLGFGPEDTPQQRLEKLEKQLAESGFAPEETVPFFAFLLSVPLVDRYVAPELSPYAQREKTIELLLAWLKARADKTAVLMAMEDLHWTDASTLDLLTRLMDEIQHMRVLILLTFRPEFQVPWNSALMGEIKLQRLSPDDASKMLEVLTKDSALPPAIFELIREKTDGVPLFIEETAKMAKKSGMSAPEKSGSLDDREQNQPIKSGAIAQIPTTLRGSLMARLDRLGQAKATAQLVSMLGRDFSFDLVRAVSAIPEPEIERNLAVLTDAELLYRKGLPPHSVYRFKHSLIQDVAYESMSLGRRRRYHRHIATILAETSSSVAESRPEIIADHFTLAGAVSEAIKYWRLAGQYALERSANVEAAAHLTLALDLIAQLPASAERDQDETTLQIALGAALAAINGYGTLAVAGAYGRALELCERLGATPETFSALRGLEAFYQVRGPLSTARRIGEQLLQLAEQSQNSLAIAEAMRPLGWCFFCMGEFHDADRMLAGALKLFDPAAPEAGMRTFGIDTGVMGLANSAWVKCYLGDPVDAKRRGAEAVSRAGEAGHAQSLAYALCMTAAVHQSLGDAAATQRLAEQTITLAKDNAYSYWLAWASILQGWAIAEQGNGVDGIETLRAGLAAYGATGAQLFQPYSLGLLADTCKKAGLLDEAATLVEEALNSSSQNEVHFYDAELHRLQGSILASSGMESAVEGLLAKAVDIACSQGSLLFELRALISLCRFDRDTAEDSKVQRRMAELSDCFGDNIKFANLVEGRAIAERC